MTIAFEDLIKQKQSQFGQSDLSSLALPQQETPEERTKRVEAAFSAEGVTPPVKEKGTLAKAARTGIEMLKPTLEFLATGGGMAIGGIQGIGHLINNSPELLGRLLAQDTVDKWEKSVTLGEDREVPENVKTAQAFLEKTQSRDIIKEASDMIGKTTEMATSIYHPKSEMGKKASELIALPFEKAREVSDYVGNSATEGLTALGMDSERAAKYGAAIAITAEMGTYALAHKGGVRAKAKAQGLKNIFKSSKKSVRDKVTNAAQTQDVNSIINDPEVMKAMDDLVNDPAAKSTIEERVKQSKEAAAIKKKAKAEEKAKLKAEEKAKKKAQPIEKTIKETPNDVEAVAETNSIIKEKIEEETALTQKRATEIYKEMTTVPKEPEVKVSKRKAKKLAKEEVKKAEEQPTSVQKLNKVPEVNTEVIPGAIFKGVQEGIPGKIPDTYSWEVKAGKGTTNVITNSLDVTELEGKMKDLAERYKSEEKPVTPSKPTYESQAKKFGLELRDIEEVGEVELEGTKTVSEEVTYYDPVSGSEFKATTPRSVPAELNLVREKSSASAKLIESHMESFSIKKFDETITKFFQDVNEKNLTLDEAGVKHNTIAELFDDYFDYRAKKGAKSAELEQIKDYMEQFNRAWQRTRDQLTTTKESYTQAPELEVGEAPIPTKTGEVETPAAAPSEPRAPRRIKVRPKEAAAPLTKEEGIAKLKAAHERVRQKIIERKLEEATVPEDLATTGDRDLASDLVDLQDKSIFEPEFLDESGIVDAVRDLLGDERGSISFENLTHQQQMALQKLEAKARQMGKTLEEILIAGGMNTDNAKKLGEHALKIDRDLQPYSTKPVNKMLPEGMSSSDVQQRTNAKGEAVGPMIHRDWVDIVISTSDLIQREVISAFENPIYTFEKMKTMMRTNGSLKQFYHEWRDREKLTHEDYKEIQSNIKKLKKKHDLTHSSGKRIGIYAISKEGVRGKNLLNNMGIKLEDVVDIEREHPNEYKAYQELRGWYETFFEQINEARTEAGMKKIKYENEYFTFVKASELLQKKGVFMDYIFEEPKDIVRDYEGTIITPFRFGKARRGGLKRAELDAFEIMDIYAQKATRHIRMAPLNAVVKELASKDLVLRDGSIYNMRKGYKGTATGKKYQEGGIKLESGEKVLQAKKKLSDFLLRWNDTISGRPAKMFGPQEYPTLNKIAGRLQKNLGVAIMGYNVRTFAIQLSAIRNTIPSIGINYTIKGIDALTPGTKMYKFVKENSRNIYLQTPETIMADVLSTHGKSWLGTGMTVAGKMSMKPMQWSDGLIRRVTWSGAYKLATEKGNMGTKDAIRFADDIVTKTQASSLLGDLAPIQRNNMGKLLTAFQTFVINDWNFLTKDILKNKGLTVGGDGVAIKNGSNLVKVVEYVAATTLLSALYENIGLSSPFPTPIRDVITGIKEDQTLPEITKNVALEFIEPLPVLGGAFRYGTSPFGAGVEYASDVTKILTDYPIKKDWKEVAATGAGIPGTREVSKYIRGQKRGESVIGSLLGTYSEKEKKESDSSGLKKFKGLKNSGLKAPLK